MEDAIGDFLMVDDESLDIMHSTYVRILVEVDIFKRLPEKSSWSILTNFGFKMWTMKGFPLDV